MPDRNPMRRLDVDLELDTDYLVIRITKNGCVVAQHTVHAPCVDGSVDGALVYLKGRYGSVPREPPSELLIDASADEEDPPS